MRTVQTRRLPKDPTYAFVTAENTHAVVFDNISHLSGDWQDTLCLIATGGADETRTLHTTRDVSFFQASNPMILTSISSVVTRADLLSRCLVWNVEAPTNALTDEEVDAQ